MDNFNLLAQPWWVNLLVLIPVAVYFLWRKGLDISRKILYFTAIFGIAFGYVEAAVVVYLRKIFDLLVTLGFSEEYSSKLPSGIPHSFIRTESLREIATMVMLAMIAFIAAKKSKERWAIFIWTFAFWDIFYYIWLWLLLKWPTSLHTQDVLFLLPVPWISEVWFPVLTSFLAIAAVILRRKNGSLGLD